MDSAERPSRASLLGLSLVDLVVLAAVFQLGGQLDSVLGRALGPRFGWEVPVVLSVVVYVWAGRARAGEVNLASLTDKARDLGIAVLSWPALAELMSLDVHRKRVLFVGCAAAGYVVAAPVVHALVLALLRRPRAAWAASGAVIVALVVLWIRGPSTPARPEVETPPTLNFLLISIDTTRADSLGCYGNERPTSPNMDRLAEGGLLFQSAIAQAPHTHSSMASLLTSKYPIEHRSVSLDPWLENDYPTLAEHLWRQGYTTAAFLDNPWLTREFGFHRGYEDFTEEADNDDILEWLEDNRAARFFLHVHLLHPHGPYEPRSPWIERFSPEYSGDWPSVPADFLEKSEVPGHAQLTDADLERFRALYAAEVRAMDEDIGALLDRLEDLGLADETLVLLVGDHGEEFFDHGALNHSHTVYEELIRVPLIMRLPGVLPAGEQVDWQVELVDLLPTTLDLLGMPPLEGARGTSQASSLATMEPPDDVGIAVSQRYNIQYRHLLSASDGRWKLHILLTPTGRDMFLDWEIADVPTWDVSWRNRYRLFDLDSDPGETTDVYEENPEVVERLIAALIDWRETNDPRISLGAQRQQGLPSNTARLRALGYVGEADALEGKGQDEDEGR